jgi:molybdenum cofactor guanylyltransferase
MTRAGGIVLCGGRSSRMCRPKAWLPFGDEVLLQRVVRVLREVVSPVAVVAAPGQDLPPMPADVLAVRDDREYLGPLNGLAAGLAALSGIVDIAYLSSCDVPFLRPAFVRRVIERIGDADISMPEVGGFKHPLAAAYRMSVLPAVRELLAANRLRPVFLTEMRPTRILREIDLNEVDPGLRSLRNLNTPEDYAAALDELAREEGHAPAGPG